MTGAGKRISNPFSTGGGGLSFEVQIQASFVALMLAEGYAPCLPCQPINKVKLQGRFAGFATDDMIVFTGEGPEERKLLGQIKHTIRITETNQVFGEVIRSAWADFNNSKVFTRGRDVIALITGPLTKEDTSDVRTLLEWVRHAESAQEFLEKVETTTFSSQSKKTKLRAFRRHLDAARGAAISDGDFYLFLRHFHLLGYDLDIKSGVMHAMLNSLIGRHSRKSPMGVWAQIVQEVMFANQNAGTITRTSLPEELREAFTLRGIQAMPEAVVETLPPRTVESWKVSELSSALVVANLMGSWNEQSQADMEIIRRLVEGPFEVWQSQIRQIVQLADTPLSLRNGIWTVKQRGELWQALGSCVFDSHLDLFQQCALTVLKECDPQFELDSGERYAASIHGKVLSHSEQLRKGLAEGLALLGSRPSQLTNCSQGKSEATAALAVRELLGNANWILWGSLNDLLSLLAEASPREFLLAVENAISQSPCPFDALFRQEGNGITGRNYLTGLLWALESIAWEEQHLVRATLALGALAERDPGGQWANRPSNSLSEIFLPWLPQTTASIEKRKVAVQTLCRESPAIAWRLLLSLLPGQITTSSQTHRPIWRRVLPDDWKDSVTQGDYWAQVTIYAHLAEQMAVQDTAKLEQLVSNLDHLPRPTLENILDHVVSNRITEKPEDERMTIWMALVEQASKHRRFSNANWAFPDDLVSRIEAAAARIEPSSAQNRYRRLFGERDWDLYEENGNWRDQERKLEQRRREAVLEILQGEGVAGVVRFAESVESPQHVGFSLGHIETQEVDSAILPAMLHGRNDTEKLAHLAAGFVRGRFQHLGWSWVDATMGNSWARADIGRTLSLLPFVTETWHRVNALLGENAAEYWQTVVVNPYQEDGDLYIAIDQLIRHNRPWAALDCLARHVEDKRPLDRVRAVRALLDAVSSDEAYNSHDAIQVIKALQEDPDTDDEDLFKVEWAYLPLLDDHHGTAPSYLETRLATDSSFFCELIRIVYHSDKEPRTHHEPSESRKALARNAWRLLHEWRTPPGISGEEFSGEKFRAWIDGVIRSASESGHLNVALSNIGSVLIHSPRDPDGLSIHRAVAEVLNRKELEPMRRGFSTAIFNSRGVHWVDPTGKPEKELADKYRVQAEELENGGYYRLATTLRGVADSYEHEAKRIIDEHAREQQEDS